MNTNILKKMSIYFVGTLSTKLLGIILVPIYAYFVSASELGEYDYIVAISSIVFPVVYFVVWEAILKYGLKPEKRIDKESLFSTILLFSVGMTIIGILIILLIYFIKGKSLNILLIMFFVIIQGLTSIWQYSARALGETKRFVASSIVGTIAILTIEILFIIFGELNYIGLCIANIFSQLLVIIVLEQKIKLIYKIHFSKFNYKILKESLIFTIPLVINNVSLYLYNSGSKMIIKNFIGSYENGLYSFASKFSLLISIFSIVISMAVIEEAYSYKTIEEYRDKMALLISKISRGYLSLILIALPSIYILYSFAFLKTDYYTSVNYVFLLLVGALFTALANNFGSAFQVTNNTKYISITTIIGAVVALLISILTVNKLGVVGVLLGNAIGPLVMMLSRALFAKKTTGLSISWPMIISIFIVCIIEYLSLMSMKNILWQSLILFVSIIIDYFININDIKIIIQKFIMKGKLK